jgi:hypothetical protein
MVQACFLSLNVKHGLIEETATQRMVLPGFSLLCQFNSLSDYGVVCVDQKKEASIKKEAVKEQKAPASKEDSNKASIAGKVQQAA